MNGPGTLLRMPALAVAARPSAAILQGYRGMTYDLEGHAAFLKDAVATLRDPTSNHHKSPAP